MVPAPRPAASRALPVFFGAGAPVGNNHVGTGQFSAGQKLGKEQSLIHAQSEQARSSPSSPVS